MKEDAIPTIFDFSWAKKPTKTRRTIKKHAVVEPRIQVNNISEAIDLDHSYSMKLPRDDSKSAIETQSATTSARSGLRPKTKKSKKKERFPKEIF